MSVDRAAGPSPGPLPEPLPAEGSGAPAASARDHHPDARPPRSESLEAELAALSAILPPAPADPAPATPIKAPDR